MLKTAEMLMYKTLCPIDSYSQDLDMLKSLARQYMSPCSAAAVSVILPAAAWALRPMQFCPELCPVTKAYWPNCRRTTALHTRQQSQPDRAKAPAWLKAKPPHFLQDTLQAVVLQQTK